MKKLLILLNVFVLYSCSGCMVSDLTADEIKKISELIEIMDYDAIYNGYDYYITKSKYPFYYKETDSRYELGDFKNMYTINKDRPTLMITTSLTDYRATVTDIEPASKESLLNLFSSQFGDGTFLELRPLYIEALSLFKTGLNHIRANRSSKLLIYFDIDNYNSELIREFVEFYALDESNNLRIGFEVSNPIAHIIPGFYIDNDDSQFLHVRFDYHLYD